MPFIMEELSEPLTVDHDTLMENMTECTVGIAQLKCPRLTGMDYV